MPVSVTGRVVKAKKTSELRKSPRSNQKMIKLNHLRVQFADSGDRHFFFTDAQIKRAYKRSKDNAYDGKLSWVKEIWFEGVLEQSDKEISKIMKKNNLPPSVAKKYNHIRVICQDFNNEISLFFTDNEIRKAYNLGVEFLESSKLPKISWLTQESLWSDTDVKRKKREAKRKTAETRKAYKSQEPTAS